MDRVKEIADAILYEGYLLWPYRRSARKNARRWSFGCLFPRRWAQTSGTGDAWSMQAQCLVTGEAPVVGVTVRFLQAVERKVARAGGGGPEYVDALSAGGQLYQAWEEGRERELALPETPLAAADRRLTSVSIPAGGAREPVPGPGGATAGWLERSWERLEAEIETEAERLGPALHRLALRIRNGTPGARGEREHALRRALLSTHAVLRARGGEFVSLLDPPPALRAEAAACSNSGLWPVLAGEEGDRSTLLASPIVLYDYPRVAPESPGDLCDATEIDELLHLSILGLADAEKEEMRAADPMARAMLERVEGLAPEGLLRLHGAFRSAEPAAPAAEDPWEVLGGAPAREVAIGGAVVGPGSRVLLRPRAGGDVMDLALAGRVAVVESLEQDYEGRVHLAVTLEEDPGRDLGGRGMPGHRFFFTPEEVEPVGGEPGERGAP